jgi:DNA-binding winged helix-turn-helix (wHTH) protein
MQPTSIKQLIQEAVNQGQVVMVPTPAKPPSQRPTTPPLRNRSEASLTAAFCLLFKLTRSESHILVQLLMHDYGAKEDLRNAESTLVGRSVTDNTVQTIICALRKKLKPYNVRIVTIPSLGYGLDKDARYRIRTILARYDTGFVPKRPRSKPKAAEQHVE